MGMSRLVVRLVMDWLQMGMGLRMDVEMGLLIVVFITVALLLVIVGKPLVTFVSDGIVSFDPAGDLILGVGQFVDIVLNVVLFLISNAVLDSQILDLSW